MNLKISELTTGSPAQTGDEIPINRSGANFKVTAGSIASIASASFGLAAPGWWQICDGSNYPFDGSNGQWSTGTANQIKWWMIRVYFPITIKRATWRHNASLASAVGGLGIYDSTGQTKLLSWDNFTLNTGAGTQTYLLGAAVTLQPGLYIVACGCSQTGSSPTTQGGHKTQGSSDNTNGYNVGTALHAGVAANPLSAGAMPSSLGALSATSALGTSLPCVCMEPS